MTNYPRYAIYFVPSPDGDLDRFGAGLLGYDASSGEERPFADGIEQLVPDWRQLTHDPRGYGFHATLKAPMALVAGKTEADLVAGCDKFAGAPRAVPVIKPRVDSIGGFLAIVPANMSAELGQLAADCVGSFEGFRAPLTPDDRARRNPARLTSRQREYLDRWGYPYVMEEFRFHMTLTGRLNTQRSEMILPILRQRFAALKITSLAIDTIALSRQNDAGSRFRIVSRYALARSGKTNPAK